MAKDARTRGLEALAELYTDPAVREARTTELGEAGILSLGNQVLRQDDYSRQMGETTRIDAEARRLYAVNQAWWAEHQGDVEELEALRLNKPTPAADPAKPAVPDPAKTPITAEALAKTIADTERGAVAFFADLNQLSMQHYAQFGEILDTRALLSDPRVQQIGFQAVYQDKFATQLQAKAAAKTAAAEEAIRADERAKVQTQFASQHHPYPVRGNEASTLDGIQPPGNTPTVRSVDDMAAEYARLGASRSA